MVDETGATGSDTEPNTEEDLPKEPRDFERELSDLVDIGMANIRQHIERTVMHALNNRKGTDELPPCTYVYLKIRQRGASTVKVSFDQDFNLPDEAPVRGIDLG